MDIESYRAFCLAKHGVTESFPFDDKTLVFKVGNKMFAALDVDKFISINLKCDPTYALELREQYEGITPGYHMNKKHWNSVLTNGSVPDQLLSDLTEHSYNLVFKGLSKKVQIEITEL